ncbi:hypothetical protein O181_105436, partial [Austropuccinia psidii MF-1]|nr:hypothetical protein [Austropuccinia psidii MF-1]
TALFHPTPKGVPTAPTSEPDLVDETASLPLTRAPTRIKVIGPCHPTLICSNIDQKKILSHSRQAEALLTAADEAPQTFKAAIGGAAKEVWAMAIDKELQSMERLRVWDVVDLDPSYRLVGTTWVFKAKKNHLGEVTEHKACLCAQGFMQTAGVDFEQTYSPTGRLNSLRTLIAYTASNNLLFHQIDVKSAFLNAPLSETVYLSLPQGAPLAWYKRLKQWLVDVGFTACILDPCVFYRGGDHSLWLYVRVDDITIFGKEVEVFKIQIAGEFEIKDIGAADLMLGVKISQDEGCVTLDQQHYTKSPIELYRSAIGSINYLSTATRPDLSFAVSSLSQFLDRPGIKHWQGFLHVLRYLNGTQDLGLTYGGEAQCGISAYSNADWGNCQATRQSITGYLSCFNQCLVIWKTRKQPTVSLSTAEAEYKSVCDLTSELLWLKQWCQESGLTLPNGPIPVHEDNQGCINTANGDSNVNGRRMKHVDIQLHFVKEAVKCRRIQPRYTPSKKMLADFLTKSVPKPVLIHALDSLGVPCLGVRGVLEIRLTNILTAQKVSNKITTRIGYAPQ